MRAFARRIGRLASLLVGRKDDLRRVAGGAVAGGQVGAAIGRLAGPAGAVAGGLAGAVIGARSGALAAAEAESGGRGGASAGGNRGHGTSYEDAIAGRIARLEDEARTLRSDLEAQTTRLAGLESENRGLRESLLQAERRSRVRGRWLTVLVILLALTWIGAGLAAIWLGR